jgi:hypothetical protein
MSLSLNSVTNDLLLKYDENFNELYDKILSLNTSITNKEEILVKERLEMKNKDLKIEYLYSIIIFVLLLGVLLIAHATNKIDNKKLIGSIILLSLLLLVYCYILYKRSIEVPSFVKNALVDMGNFSNSLVKATFKNPYNCPANCPPIAIEEESEPSSNNFGSTITASPTLLYTNATGNNAAINNPYDKSLTGAITVNSPGGGLYADYLITTGIITVTSGTLQATNVYCSSISTSNANTRDITISDLYNLSNENILKYIISIYEKISELLNQTIKIFHSYNMICIKINNLINPTNIDSETEYDIKLLSIT